MLDLPRTPRSNLVPRYQTHCRCLPISLFRTAGKIVQVCWVCWNSSTAQEDTAFLLVGLNVHLSEDSIEHEHYSDSVRLLHLMKQYFEIFGDKACCFEDLKPYLNLEGNDLAAWTEVLQACPSSLVSKFIINTALPSIMSFLLVDSGSRATHNKLPQTIPL